MNYELKKLQKMFAAVALGVLAAVPAAAQQAGGAGQRVPAEAEHAGGHRQGRRQPGQLIRRSGSRDPAGRRAARHRERPQFEARGRRADALAADGALGEAAPVADPDDGADRRARRHRARPRADRLQRPHRARGRRGAREHRADAGSPDREAGRPLRARPQRDRAVHRRDRGPGHREGRHGRHGRRARFGHRLHARRLRRGRHPGRVPGRPRGERCGRAQHDARRAVPDPEGRRGLRLRGRGVAERGALRGPGPDR